LIPPIKQLARVVEIGRTQARQLDCAWLRDALTHAR